MKVLVFNCGSSSIKYQLFEMPGDRVLAKGMVERIGESRSRAVQQAGDRKIELDRAVADHHEGLLAIEAMLTDAERGAVASVSEISACGHRVVHGGEAVSGSVGIDDRLESVIADYEDLAPLHNPPNLTGIRAARSMMPDIPQVACFDTAFHQSLPETAFLYALPYEMYASGRVRKYGFHGTSHQYVAARAVELLGRDPDGTDLITCHLGNGCSMAAVKQGRSVDTSMGLTPLEGLMMGTRGGDLDPGVVLYLLRKGHDAEELDRVFNKESGLLGVSGISNDVRDLEAKAADGSARARLALDVFAYRARKYIGAYLAVLNGCDAVVFTGGIGENNPAMRRRILADMDNLGIRIDRARNETVVGTEGAIHEDGAQTAILVIPTNEELAIARETYRLAAG